jgi:hypothetical protein
MLNRSQSQPHREYSVSDAREIFTEVQGFAMLWVDSRHFGGAYSLTPSAAGRVARNKNALFIMKTQASWIDSVDEKLRQSPTSAATHGRECTWTGTRSEHCGGQIHSC